MAAGIMKSDKGLVSGVESTWHRLPQYKCIPDRAITIAEAVEIAGYPIDKQPLFRANGSPVDAWAIVRTDTDSVLVPAVGERFTLVQNNHMVNYISEHLLAVYPELKIQSVGTLWDGATFFLNLSLDEFQVKGDKSPTITNLMYANPLGRGAYTACAHSTRVVCANTLRIGELQGLANQSLKRFKHTASASTRINEHLIDLAEVKLELKRHVELMDYLAGIELQPKEIDTFLNGIFPEPKEDGRAKTIAVNSKDGIKNILEGSQRSTLANPFTKYALLQAFTDWQDHAATVRNGDLASVTYDGINGVRADKKDAFLKALIAA